MDPLKLREGIERERAKLDGLRTLAETRQAEVQSSLEVTVGEGQTEADARAVATLMNSEAVDAIDAAWRPYNEARRNIETMSDNLIKLTGSHGDRGAEMPALFGPRGERVSTLAPEVVQANRDGILRNAARRFSQTDVYRQMMVPYGRGEVGSMSRLSVPRVELLTRDELVSLFAVTGASATSAGAFVQNDRQAFLSLLRESRFSFTKAMQGETDSDTVEYVEQTGFTNNAAMKAEGAAATESVLAYAVRTVAVEEMRHFIKATRRALSDEAQMATMIRGDLIEGMQREIDQEFLGGSGTTPQLEGILNASGVQTQALGALSRADALHKAITLIRIVFGEPDNIGFHPADYEDLRLEKDGMGRYLFGDPSGGGAPTVWGVPWYQSTHLTSGTPLVGDFQHGSKFWLREGMTVDASDSDDLDFQKSIVTLRGQLRAASKAVRANMFCTVTGF